jgi:hypothetical protein
MKNYNVLVGIFTTVAVALFGAGLFLIGNQHKAFVTLLSTPTCRMSSG